jgi:ABC-2 type transport system permease protein
MSSYAVADTLTMARRDVKHTLRYPMMLIGSLLAPVFLLLMFIGVFGNAMHATVATATGGVASSYTAYITPAIIVMTVAFGAQTTAVTVFGDMAEGVIARFRTMSITRTSVIVGSVLGSCLRTMATLFLVTLSALAVGFRPAASPLDWLGVVALLAGLSLAFTWLAVAMGMGARTLAGASGSTVLLQFLPFVSSAFVPTSTMPEGVRWFAEYQPFSSIIDTLRGLLTGTPIGGDGWIAAAWCAGLTVLGFFWARRTYDRDPQR